MLEFGGKGSPKIYPSALKLGLCAYYLRVLGLYRGCLEGQGVGWIGLTGV